MSIISRKGKLELANFARTPFNFFSSIQLHCKSCFLFVKIGVFEVRNIGIIIQDINKCEPSRTNDASSA